MRNQNTPSLKNPEVLFMSLFGIGFLPMMPGTYGSLATLPFLYLLGLFKAPFFIYVPFLLIVTFISSFIAEIIQKRYHLHDPSWIVIDEALGMFTAWLFIAGPNISILKLVVLFALFRFFDIVNWKNLLGKKIDPPYKPVVKSENDTSNFGHYSSSDEYLVPSVKPKDDPFLQW